MIVYAGTTTERAQATWDVTQGELRRLAGSITTEELERCKVRAKSSLIACCRNQRAPVPPGCPARLVPPGRLTTLEEVRREVESLTAQQ